MTSRNSPLSRAIAALLLAVLGALILILSYQKQHWDSDILWALKSGEWILSHFTVPKTDPFSYTFGGRPWVDFTWGFQVMVKLAFDYLGGWTGLYALLVVLVSATFAFVFVTLRKTVGHVWIAIALLFLAFACSSTRLFMRPHLFEYFFVSLYFMLFTLYEKKGKRAYLYAMIPLQVVWVNVHSSAVLGLFMAASYAAGEVIDTIRERGLKVDLTAGIKRYIFVGAALPVAALLNPYGWRLVVFPFIHHGVDNKDAIRHIGEWTKPHLKELFFYFYPFPIDHFAFAVLALLAALLILLNYRRLKSRSIFLIGLAAYMASSHVRWVALFAFFAVPVIAGNLSSLLGESGKETAESSPFKKASVEVSIFLSIFIAWSMASDMLGHGFRRHLGAGLNDGQFPSGTVDFMKKNGVKGNIYNDYVFGGYLVHEYPEVKVFIDGRTPTVYSSYFFWTSRLVSDKKLWDKVVSEHGIDIALVKVDNPFCGTLKDNPDWAAVSFDDASVLFLKKSDAFKGIVSKSGLPELNPCYGSSKYTLPEDTARLKAIREELKRAISDGGEPFARPHRILGLVDLKLGGELLKEAEAELGKAAGIAMDAETWYDYGVALGRSSKKKEAAGAFLKTIELDGKLNDAFLGAGLAFHDMKEHKEAVCYLKQYVEMADDKADPEAYKALGLSYFESSRFEEAATYLKRAAFLLDDPKELGRVHYHIGNSLSELGLYTEALIHYSKAIASEPGYVEVLKALAFDLERRGLKERASIAVEAAIPVRK